MNAHRVPTYLPTLFPDRDVEAAVDTDTSSSYSNEDDVFVLWRKFEGQPRIPGFMTNVVMCFRESFGSNPGSQEPGGERHLEEENLATEVSKYLLNNGVKSVQVVSNFAEHVPSIALGFSSLKEDLGVEVEHQDLSTNDIGAKTKTVYDSVDVTVIILTGCTGRWQQLKMWEMVRDAFHTSRLGVILLGHKLVIEDTIFEDKWNDFVSYLQGTTGLKDHLEIVCAQHKLIHRQILTAQDLRTQSPFGGCGKFCGDMDCGHYCHHQCHPGDRHHTSEKYRCMQRCRRVCAKGHRCKLPCWMPCDRCTVVVDVVNACEHWTGIETQRFCYEEQERCQILVRRSLECGHVARVQCSRDMGSFKCPQMLAGELPCGHTIIFRCSDNMENAHLQCAQPVTQKFECGHETLLTCAKSTSRVGPLQCGEACNGRLKCGHPCERRCHLDDPDHEMARCDKPCRKYCVKGFHQCPRQGQHPCHEPCGPCVAIYDFALSCGHYVKLACSAQPPDESNYVCQRKCVKVHCGCQHPCDKKCFEECGECEATVIKRCSRGHPTWIRCPEARSTKCTEKAIPLAKSECGHRILVNCYEADSISKYELAALCPFPCEYTFDEEKECGHKCRGTCGDCFQGRLHVRCQEPCGKTLFCGHSCTNPCGAACPPCRYPCVNSCEHDKCKFECGVPCERNCEHPCVYKCEHSACSKKCGEVCDKPICNEPCADLLECGHPCVGFCGEPCPPHCRVCTPEQLLLGTFSGDSELDPAAKFIFLPDCKHSVESGTFESWLNAKSEEKEILPIRCPICVTRVNWIRRYSAKFQENGRLVDSIREKIFGNRQEIEDILQEMEAKLTRHVRETENKHFIPEYAEYLQMELTRPRSAEPQEKDGEFKSMSLDKARFLNWMCDQWVNCSEMLVHLEDRIPKNRFELLVDYWKEYLLDMAADRVWPMHPNEIRGLTLEWKRMDDVVALYSRLDTTQNVGVRRLINSEDAQELFAAAERLVRDVKPYSLRKRERFLQQLKELDAMLHCTLQLSDRERVQIVHAFGEASGRWFKCVNGHVYVVTECGGATEVGTCNECGAPIGGENHVLVPKNYLASEMDGARAPLYPTVLHRHNQ